MTATIPTARLSRLALFAITGATALSLAACGSSNDAKPTSSSPTGAAPTSSPAPSAKGEGHDRIKGLIDSVSGSTIQVSQRSGAATVDFTPSTKVDELTPAQLSDVANGSCISVRPDRHADQSGGNAVTARSVRISTAVDGKCPEPKHPTGPAGSPGAPGPHHGINGQVTSVAGNTITVSTNGSSQSTVNVTDTTTYTKKSATDAQAIAAGKCLEAFGAKDGAGALQASSITVEQANNGQCAEAGGGGHHHH